jgi:putative DNA primase/helicase
VRDWRTGAISSPSMNAMLKAALRYANRYGWRVFPLNGKEPRVKGGFRIATTDERTIRRWWKKWPDANIGIACDSEHGPVVIDLDEPKDEEVSGFQFLKTLELPREGLVTRSAVSREGRLHLYFLPMRDGTRLKRMIRPFTHKDQKVAMDILGDGGYVVAPPSIHPDTREPYRWEQRIDLAPFPKRLFRFLHKRSIKKIAPPLPAIIREGERDQLLTSLAGTMRRRGASPRAILEALRIENASRVRPPLADDQLQKIAKSIGNKAPAGEEENLTDLGNVRRFVNQHHERIRSVLIKKHNPWFLWVGTHWEPDSTGEAMRLAKQTVRSIHAEAERTTDEERRAAMQQHAYKSEGAERIRAIIDLAKTEPEIALREDQLDRDQWLFNVQNGTIDLSSGRLLKHKKSDYITKMSPIEFQRSARAPRWQGFLDDIFAGDKALIGFIQRAMGYTLTGDIREHAMFFCYGQGRNGKSTFLETFRALMAGYSVQAEFSTFQSMRNDGPRHDLARMRGARLVAAIEARADRSFDETVIKQMTGGDTVTARNLYESSFEFKPQFKLWLAANHLPLVREQTEAFWSRILMIPFTVIIPAHKRKKNLGKLLAKELSGVLNWVLEGCEEWRRHGLMAPDTVRRAITEYKEEYDVIGEFFKERCRLDPEEWTARAQLYQSFADWWMETRGRNPLSHTAFNRLVSERTDLRQSKRRGGLRGWRGIGVMDVRRHRSHH